MSESHTCPACGRKYPPSITQCPRDGAALYGPKAAARLGQELGSYELRKILGVGGMGVVYEARHVILDKPVAIKVLSERYARREGGVEQFLREARAATRIRHPNIVDVTDFGTAPDGSVFFVMEMLEGITLEDVLARDGTVPLFNAVNIVRQMCHALAAAHEVGIVHRDLKPENVFLISRKGRRKVVRRVAEGDVVRFVVEKEDKFDFVKLFDFGVAKYTTEDVAPSTATRAGMLFGTPQYMSPEQARGELVDGRSDIYALGVLFYEMVTGVVPFDGETALDILNGHVSGEVIPPARRNPGVKVDAGTNETILACLAKRKEERYQSMDELLVALQSCFTDQVFLRDAHLMPGAAEAGIVAPTNPRAQAGAPARPTGPRRSITDELSELFSATAREKRALDPLLERPAVDRRATARTADVPQVHADPPPPADKAPLADSREGSAPGADAREESAPPADAREESSPGADGREGGSPRERRATNPGLGGPTPADHPRRHRRQTSPLGSRRNDGSD